MAHNSISPWHKLNLKIYRNVMYSKFENSSSLQIGFITLYLFKKSYSVRIGWFCTHGHFIQAWNHILFSSHKKLQLILQLIIRFRFYLLSQYLFRDIRKQNWAELITHSNKTIWFWNTHCLRENVLRAGPVISDVLICLPRII